MERNEKQWIIPPHISPQADHNLRTYHPVLRQILFNRGYSDPQMAHEYLNAERPHGTSPYNLSGMQRAIERIQKAIRNRQKIAIYGDYDVDGVTATALLVETFQLLGSSVIGYIPNRFEEGYGVNLEALETLADDGVELIITVDCGIRSHKEVAYANTLGVDMIVSDHHHPDKNLPPAISLINPKQQNDSYPEKDLAGVGLAYKISAALLGEDKASFNFLDLVALGTIADLAPLVGENRALVREGIVQIRRPKRQGLMALMGVSGLTPGKIKASHIGFTLGPRLNAAGRIDSALGALRLLTTQDVSKAARIAQQLDNQNRERQKITQEIQSQAEIMAFARTPDPILLYASDQDFNPGVIGLAASRLVDAHYRPAIVVHLAQDFARGSCRSIPEFHITDALDQCADLLEHHGGHAAAAGFTIQQRHLPELVERLEAIALERLSDLDLRKKFSADMEIPLSELKPEILDYLEWIQPTGYGNRQAYFVSRNLKVSDYRKVGRDQTHLKLVVSDGNITYDAIAFRLGYWFEQMPTNIDLLYSFELNEYNGRSALQLNVRDIKSSGG